MPEVKLPIDERVLLLISKLMEVNSCTVIDDQEV